MLNYILVLISVLACTLAKADNNDNLVKIRFLLGEVNKQNLIITAALQIDIKDGWHIYYKEPGDIGLPTTITGQDNIKNIKLHWPKFLKYSYNINNQKYVSNIYKNTVVLPMVITLARNDVVSIKVEYAVCSDICIPQVKYVNYDKEIVDFSDDNVLKTIKSWQNR